MRKKTSSVSDESILGRKSGEQAKPERKSYVLIDSVDVISQLHQLIGARPSSSQLPNWEALIPSLETLHPETEWAPIYFMAVGATGEGASGFAEYLTKLGFKVVQLRVKFSGSVEQGLNLRRQETANAIAKTLTALALREVQHLYLASHNAALAEPLASLLLQKGMTVSLACFPEQLPDELLSLVESGLELVDLERKIGLFQKPLAARQVVLPEAYDPESVL